MFILVKERLSMHAIVSRRIQPGTWHPEEIKMVQKATKALHARRTQMVLPLQKYENF
jgi:hypothetical protein